MTAPLLIALRQGTAEAHRALETEIDFLNDALTRDTYLQSLRIFDAFVATWEAQASQHCPPDLAEFWLTRRRARLLTADLDFFAARPIAGKPALPPLETRSSFFGALYVMEGSTLGGQVIARQLESRLGLSEGKGYSYFRGRGADTGRMWKEFIDLVTNQSPTLNEPEVVLTATATFEAFRSFYSRQMQETA